MCGSCDRLDLPCVYESTPLPSTLHANAGLPGTWSLADLELLHHYSTCSCLQFKPDTPRHRCWTNDVPQTSFSHPYLLYQILAVAALHLYTDHPHRTDWAHAATSHRATALEQVKPVMATANPGTGIPVFAFAGLTAVYAFGELAIQRRNQGAEHDAVEHLLACIKLTRGIRTVISAHRYDIENTWAGEMINLNADTELARLQATGLRFQQMDVLEAMIKDRSRTPTEASVLTHAAHTCLRSIQILMAQHDDDNEIYYLIMTWPNDVSEEYIECVERREPMALVILAHYGVLMNMRPKLWWLREWPGLLVRQAEDMLGTEWSEYLKWPRMMLEANA